MYKRQLLHGFKGISILAKSCVYLFFGLLAFVLLFGGEAKYIIETGAVSYTHLDVYKRQVISGTI